MTEVIDFIVNDAAFKLQEGMTKNPTHKCDLFIDTGLFEFNMLSFIFWIDNNGIEAYAYDYKPDDDTLNYFINLSNEDRSVIEKRILNKIKGIEVSSTDETEWVDAVWPQDHGKPARFWPNPIYQDEGTPDDKLWDLGTIAGYVADGYRKWIMEMNGKISCQMYCQVKKNAGTLEQATQPPDGWRWLEAGEVIRKGDQGFEKNLFHAIEPIKIGMTLQAHWMPTIRRNKFEVGEKVVRVSEPRGIVFQVKCAFLDNSYGLATEGGMVDRLHAKDLAPYIEDQS